MPSSEHSLSPLPEQEKQTPPSDLPFEADPPDTVPQPGINNVMRPTSRHRHRSQHHRFHVGSVLNDFELHDEKTSHKFAKIFATGDFPPVTFFSWTNCPTPELISADPGQGGQLLILLAPLQQRFAKHFQAMQTQRRRQLHSNIISAVLAVITFITSVISTVLAQGAGSRGATIATTVVTVIGSGLNSLFLSMGLIKTTSFGQQARLHGKVVREIMALYFQIKSGMFNDKKEELMELISKQTESDQTTVEE